MFKTIGSKIIAVFGLVASIAMLGIIAFYTYNQSHSILAQNERAMHKLTVSVIEGLQTVMLSGHAEIAQNYMARLKRVPEVTDFVIMRTNGREAFLDNNTLKSVNQRLASQHFQPKTDERLQHILPPDNPELQRAIASSETVSYYEVGAEHERLMTYLVPIPNAPGCTGCHGDDKPIRGVLKLTTSLEPLEADIARTRYQSLLVLVLMLAGVLLVTSLLIRRSVVRPINALIEAMNEVSRGDMAQLISVEGRDELSRMAASFNKMSREVLSSYRGLKREQDKLNTILQSSLDGIVVTDSHGHVVLVNPAAERLLGKTADEIGTNGFLAILDEPELIIDNLCQDPSRLEPKMVEYKGRMLQLLASSILAPSGEMIGSAALLRDVTEEKKLELQLRQMSTTDGLTKLYNRRHLDSSLAQELKLARRYQMDLSILMLDVDHFKNFNDEHGHDQGDRVLQAIAALMRETVREVDIPCRYGGEEFMIILTNTPCNGALATAERLRQLVEQTRIDGLQVTISIGIASFPYSDLDSVDQFIELADNALYRAKKQGRNCVCAA